MITENELKILASEYPAQLTNTNNVPFGAIIDTMSENEEVKLAFPTYMCLHGARRFRFAAVVITSKRIIIAGKPSIISFKPSVFSFSLNKISSCGNWGANITVNITGDKALNFSGFSNEVKARLSSKIQEIVDGL